MINKFDKCGLQMSSIYDYTSNVKRDVVGKVVSRCSIGKHVFIKVYINNRIRGIIKSGVENEV